MITFVVLVSILQLGFINFPFLADVFVKADDSLVKLQAELNLNAGDYSIKAEDRNTKDLVINTDEGESNNDNIVCETADGTTLSSNSQAESRNYCYTKTTKLKSDVSKREASILEKIKLAEAEDSKVTLRNRSGTGTDSAKGDLNRKGAIDSNGSDSNSNRSDRSQTDGATKHPPAYINCSFYTELIDIDLKPFSKGITSDMIEAGKSRGIIYQIIDGKLYRDKNCNFPSRCSGVEHFLLKVLKSKSLPDMEFIINVSDWPRVNSWSPELLPIFSFSKNKDYADITYPAWTFWEGGPALAIYPKGIGRWDLMRKSLISTSSKILWKDKRGLGFFRGSRTSSERDALVLLSRKYSQLVDAQYTKNQAWKSDADTLNAPAANEASFEQHCEYKFLFNYRGVAASFRFKHLFLCRSLVFHVGNDWMEFFYPALKPWIHYVPVETTASENDLKFLLEFFLAHDHLASKIASRGYEFIKSNLKLAHVECYWKHLLTTYAKLISYKVERRMDLIPIV